MVELLGGPATHPFLPLLLPEMVDVALQVGLEDSRWRLGSQPAGIWSPECGYRPGLGRHLAARGVTHFLVDEQTVTDSGGSPSAGWTVDGTDVVAVPRDLEVTNLIWSSRSGYPTAAAYRDFHAREPSTGAHLWAITGQDVPPSAKAPYDPEAAAAQVSRDVASFVTAVSDRLHRLQRERGRPGLVVAAYDTELFGHWWHEGPAFLAQAVRALRAAGVTVTTLERALADGHVEGPLELGPGSWGAGKDFSVWDGPQVSSIVADNAALQRRWLSVMAAERDGHRLGERRPDLDQLLRTLLNALSSDWAFMVTRDQAVDYARRRAGGHRDDFHRLASLVEGGDATGARGGGTAPGPHRPDVPVAGCPDRRDGSRYRRGASAAQQPGRHAAHDRARAGRHPRATALAATTEPGPMSVPRRTVTFVPIQTSSPIRTGDLTRPWSLMGTAESSVRWSKSQM